MSAPARDHHDEEVEVGSIYDRRLLRRLLQFARPHAAALGGSVALLVLSLAVKLVGPWIIRRLIDGPATQAVRQTADGTLDLPPLLAQVTHWGLLFLGVAVAGAVLLVAREWLMNRTGQRIVLELRNVLFDHLLAVCPWAGTTATRWAGPSRAARATWTRSPSCSRTGVATVAYDLLTIGVIMVVLLFLAPQLALVALLMLPAMIWVSFRFRLNARVAYRATRASLSRLNAFLQERLAGLAVVRLFRREAASSRRFDQLNTQYYRDNMVTVKHFSLFFPTVDALSSAVKMGCMAWGGWLLVHGSLTTGVFFQFWMYLDFVFEPIRELAERYNVLQAAMAAAERIFGILDTPSELGAAAPAGAVASAALAAAGPAPTAGAAGAAPAAARPCRGARPRHAGHRVSRRVLRLRLGAARAAGRLLRRGERRARGRRGPHRRREDHARLAAVPLHEVQQGQIRVHGHDVRRGAAGRTPPPHHDRAPGRVPLQRHAGRQHPHGRAGHAAGAGWPRRPRRSRPTRSSAGCRRATRRGWPSAAATFRPGRAPARRLRPRPRRAPDILVLDEATSSVDSETEALIERATARLMQGRTCLVIAHRLSTVVNADRILVMHKGGCTSRARTATHGAPRGCTGSCTGCTCSPATAMKMFRPASAARARLVTIPGRPDRDAPLAVALAAAIGRSPIAGSSPPLDTSAHLGCSSMPSFPPRPQHGHASGWLSFPSRAMALLLVALAAGAGPAAATAQTAPASTPQAQVLVAPALHTAAESFTPAAVCATFSVPLARTWHVGQVNGRPQLGLAGSSIWSFRALDTWPDGAVKWALCEARSPPATRCLRSWLTVTPGSGSSGQAPLAADLGSQVVVNTGPLQIAIAKQPFQLFNTAIADGKTLVASAGTGGIVAKALPARCWPTRGPPGHARVQRPGALVVRVDGTLESANGRRSWTSPAARPSCAARATSS